MCDTNYNIGYVDSHYYSIDINRKISDSELEYRLYIYVKQTVSK